MDIIRLIAQVDENRRLVANVPDTVLPGTVEILLEVPSSADDAEATDWTRGVARAWADELADPRQDIYTLADGEPVDDAG